MHVLNSLESDQAQQVVGSDLGPNAKVVSRQQKLPLAGYRLN